MHYVRGILAPYAVDDKATRMIENFADIICGVKIISCYCLDVSCPMFTTLDSLTRKVGSNRVLVVFQTMLLRQQ
jgi:hypothetical protein